MSSGNRRLTVLSQRVSLFRIGRFKTPKFLQFTCVTYLQDIVNIAKIHRLYSWDLRGWCSDKKEVIFYLLKKDESTSDPSSRPPAGWQSHYNKEKLLLIV